MRIAIDARILPTSTGRYAQRLLEHLQVIDKNNDYLVLLDKEGYGRWRPISPNFQKILAPYSMYGSDGQIKMARLLKKLRPDVTHFTFQQTALPYRGKKVVTIHDLTQLRFKNVKGSRLVYGIKQRLLAAAMKRSAKSARLVITPTEFVKRDAMKRFKLPAGKIIVTYEAAEPSPDITPRPYPSLSGKRFALYVGTAHAHKNLHRLVDAFALLSRSDPTLALVIVGRRSQFHERLERYVVAREIHGVVFTGFVEDAQLAWLYGHALFYVFPSLSEGFGLPGLEAMAYGTPVVSSHATCLPEVYGQAARYFDPNNTEDMAQKMLEVATNERLRRRLAQAGQQQVARYSWRRMAEQTLAAYHQAAGR